MMEYKIVMNSNIPDCTHEGHPARTLSRLPPATDLGLAAKMLKALGDPERLRIIARLVDGEMCVSELAELEGEKVNTISARLKTLHAVNLVSRRRDAKHIYYALTDRHVLDLIQTAIEHAAENAARDRPTPIEKELHK
jgi:ArsR family transcriptional regulator, lead/cadmium/zinc/bismuth-responsive transcriptional repressor